MAEEKEAEENEHMRPLKVDTSQIRRGVLKPERALKPEPAYREVVVGLRKEVEAIFQNPEEKLRISCCIEGCCVSWCCVQIS